MKGGGAFPLGLSADLIARSLARGEVVRLPIAGRSMAPLLLPGDEIEVEALAGGIPRAGEVLLLLARDGAGAAAGLVVHRLLRRTRDGILVRGDGARSADPLWPAASAIGVVRARWREGTRSSIGARRIARWRGLLAGRLPRSLRRLIPPPRDRLRASGR